MRARILFFVFLFISFHAFSGSGDFRFKRITNSDGLSNSWVRCAYQDDFGYIWFGTDDGLNRFDGRNIKVFRPLNADKIEMGNVSINSIIRIDTENIWLCTEIGLYRFNFKDEAFLNDSIIPPHPVLSAVRDMDGNIWFGTNGGLYKMNPGNKQKTLYQNVLGDNKSLSDNYINTIKTDTKGNIWIGTKKGLNLYVKESDSFKSYIHQPGRNSLSGNDITCIEEDSMNRLWVGTALDGLNAVRYKNGEANFKKILNGSVYTLLADNTQTLWVGFGDGGGIDILDLKKFDKGEDSYVHLKNDPLDKYSLGDNSVFKFFRDRNNDLWVLTFGAGVDYFSYRTKKFQVAAMKYGTDQSIRDNLINAFFEEDQYLWIGTEGGLDRVDKTTGKYRHYQYQGNNPRSLGSNAVYAILKDSRGNLWVGNWGGGLNLYNYQTDDFTRFMPGNDPGSLGSANVFSIIEDSCHNLWIGTISGGLNKFDYKTKKFIKYIGNGDNAPGKFEGRSMSQIYQTSDGNLYISMFSYLERYNYRNDKFEMIVPKQQGVKDEKFRGNIQFVFEDSKKNIWIATTAGLNLYNPTTNTYINYSVKDGLPDNTIQGILEDSHGNLWISTTKGLSKFLYGVNLPPIPNFRNFTIFDGLPANDFKRRAAYKNKEGVMFFGTSSGYTYFHPDSIHLNGIVPDLVFTQFLLLETSPNENSKFREISRNINMSDQLELHYPNIDFSISFAALNYLNPVKNQYRYKLEGYDTEWIDAGNNTNATYTNLIEGKYVFNVMGSNNDGVWNPIPRRITIKILPPWWRTAVFKVFLVFIIIFSIAIFIVTRFVILKRDKRLLEAIIDKRTNELSKLNNLLEAKQKIILEQNDELSKHRNNLEKLVEERTRQLAAARLKAEESDRLKSAFLANMSHEIRTPMNAIVGFSNLLVSPDLPVDKREKYSELIKNNSKLLFVLINDIIDISIIEANQLVLSKVRFNVNTILKELYSYYEFENKGRLEFCFTNQDSSEELFLYNDAIRFRQVMVNLLSNAFKYTDHGKIEYGYEIMKNEIRFFISDTGTGIDVIDKDKVFDHFYKSMKDKSKLYRGTGIGLAICKRLVEQMGGKIWVDSAVNVGSIFNFTLPYKKTLSD